MALSSKPGVTGGYTGAAWGLFAQQFEHIDPLYFVKPFGGSDPLPQVLPIASTAANFGFSVTVTSTGGSWLSATPAGACCSTTRSVSVIVTTGAAMAVGTYTGQIEFAAGGSVTPLTVPVTLVIAPAASTFFDNTPGQVSFSMKPGGQPPPQVMQIRNGGTGTLNWSLTTTTSNAGNWLNVTPTSGTGSTVITVSIVAANLPNGGSTAATYSGQILFQTTAGASIVSVPIGLTIAANAMPQINALSFTKPYAGKDPLSQTVTLASGSTAAFGFNVSSYTATGSTGATGGTWLDLSPSGACCSTPRAITISTTPAITLVAGSYTGEVLFDNGTQLMVVPVTLNVSSAGTSFFDNMTGQLSFFMATAATNTPPSQLLQIRNAGTGRSTGP